MMSMSEIIRRAFTEKGITSSLAEIKPHIDKLATEAGLPEPSTALVYGVRGKMDEWIKHKVQLRSAGRDIDPVSECLPLGVEYLQTIGSRSEAEKFLTYFHDDALVYAKALFENKESKKFFTFLNAAYDYISVCGGLGVARGVLKALSYLPLDLKRKKQVG